MQMESTPRSLPRRLLYGVLSGLLIVALRACLQPLMGDELPFLIAFPATVIVSVAWGSGAGMMVAILCAIAVAVPGIPPDLDDLKRPLQIGGFLVGSVVIAMVCGQAGARQPAGQLVAGAPQAIADTPLGSWLRAVLWGAFLIPLIVFVFAAWWGYERARRDAEAVVSHASDLALRHAQRTYAIALEIAKRADAVTPSDDDEARRQEAQVHQRLSDLTAGVQSVVNLNVWDARGRPLARSDLFPVNPEATVIDRAYFREQSVSPRPLGISEVIIGRQSGVELTNATIPRRSDEGRFRGVVAVSLAPKYFREYYESLAFEQPNLASFALIRIDGQIIARWPPAPDGRTRVPPDSEILKAITAGARSGGVLIPQNSGREARIASFRRLDAYPLYVVAGVSRDAMFASWGRFVGLLAGVLFPISAGLVYVSWLALKKTQRESATALQLQEQIRRRASAEKSLLQTQKLETLAMVTGGIAHDFNNLLAIVSSSLHILKRLHPDLAEQRQMQSISRAIQSGVRLTRQLLSFTRKQALRPETIDLKTWLPATESLLKTTLGSSVTWQVTVAPDVRPVHVDGGELELALINLVVNARHAMPAGGDLIIRASNEPVGHPAQAPMVTLSVADSGVGIPPELLTQVFEPFFTTRAQGAGSGLGLSQVRGFCKEAGGSVGIVSVVGTGTTVSMNLPASELPVPIDASATEQIEPIHCRVLLVEDNEELSSTTEVVLRDAGMQVVRKSGADGALSYLEGAAVLPDLVLSDIAMPGSMSGIGLAFELQKRLPEVPVILTTGYAEQLNEAVAGGLKVLAKPVAPLDLLSEIRQVLKASGARA